MTAPEPDAHQGYCWPSLGEPCGSCHRCGGGSSECAPDFGAAREAYEAARIERDRIIGNPDKSVTVAEYRGMLEQAQGAVKVAHEAWMGVGV